MRTTKSEFAPTGWDEFVGQPTLKDRLDIAVRSALHDSRKLDHILLDGLPGTGKSTMAELLAERMGVPLITVGQPVKPNELHNMLYDGELGSITFIDEIHDQSRPTLESLLPLLEAGWHQDQLFPFSTIVAGTTDPQALPPALVERFVHCRYEPYTDADMVMIVKRFAACANLTLPDSMCRAFATAAAGTPRVARGFIIEARNLASCGRRVDTMAVLRFCRRHPDGLSDDHINYLQALHDNRGKAGLAVLASSLQMHPKLVLRLERLLRERKLIFLASDGRTMTSAGRQRLMTPAAA